MIMPTYVTTIQFIFNHMHDTDKKGCSPCMHLTLTCMKKKSPPPKKKKKNLQCVLSEYSQTIRQQCSVLTVGWQWSVTVCCPLTWWWGDVPSRNTCRQGRNSDHHECAHCHLHPSRSPCQRHSHCKMGVLQETTKDTGTDTCGWKRQENLGTANCCWKNNKRYRYF